MMIDYDNLATEYARHRKLHPEVLRSLLAGGRIAPDSRVLEVGCGTGNYLVAIQALCGSSCWGLDPSEEMLARARERSTKISFSRGRAERISLPSDFFDLIFSVDVIHHVGDRLAYFQEAYRILKKPGRICTVTDSEWIIRHRQPLSTYFPETVDVELRRYPAIDDLREEMASAGFAAVGEEMVEHHYEVTDLEPYTAKAFSSLHLISPEAHRRGIERMLVDLRAGAIAGISRYVLVWGTKE